MPAENSVSNPRTKRNNTGIKGSVKNNFAELALRFAPDLVAND